MKKQSAYLLVALTTLMLSLCIIPTGLSSASDVKIVSKNYYFDTMGLLDVVGEVQNVGTSTINIVHLGATVTLTDGTVKDISGTVWVQYLAPQQKAPFYLSFVLGDILSGTTSYTTSDISSLEVSVLSADTTDKYQYPGLTITAQSTSVGTGSDDKGVYWVSGTVKNTGSDTATNLRVFGTFYNSAGEVVAVGGYDGQEVLTPSLSSGASKDFKFGAYDVNQSSLPSEYKINTYTLLVQAESPTPTGTAPQATAYPSNTYPKNTATPNPGSTSTPVTPTNPGETTAPTATETPDSGNTSDAQPTWVYAVVAVLGLAVVAGAFLAWRARKPKDNPKPVETKPTKKAKARARRKK
ncbi:MAG: hypothetical protein NWE92_04965 [Candidatus Bathyarchaeota archaeon]|nr:hypothetical protein [Candidatus Bathyarchaeota archaeon]